MDQSSPDLFHVTQEEVPSINFFCYLLFCYHVYGEIKIYIISFQILDILSRSGDIRDQSRRLYKIDRNFACFLPQIFFGEGPPNFWTWIIKFRQFPTMWPSFRAIGRGTSENAWRNKKKHHEHFIRPPVTPYGRPIKCTIWLIDWCLCQCQCCYSIICVVVSVFQLASLDSIKTLLCFTTSTLLFIVKVSTH